MNTPCKNCPNRFLGCHSTCEPYKEFDQKCKDIREAKAKANDLYRHRNEVIEKRIKQRRRH
jgi:hypothetical protein